MRISRIVSVAAIAAALTACGGETETAAPAPAESGSMPSAAAPEATEAAPASEASADTVYLDHSRDAIEAEIALTKDAIEEFKAEGLDTAYLEEQLSELESQL